MKNVFEILSTLHYKFLNLENLRRAKLNRCTSRFNFQICFIQHVSKHVSIASTSNNFKWEELEVFFHHQPSATSVEAFENLQLNRDFLIEQLIFQLNRNLFQGKTIETL